MTSLLGHPEIWPEGNLIPTLDTVRLLNRLGEMGAFIEEHRDELERLIATPEPKQPGRPWYDGEITQYSSTAGFYQAKQLVFDDATSTWIDMPSGLTWDGAAGNLPEIQHIDLAQRSEEGSPTVNQGPLIGRRVRIYRTYDNTRGVIWLFEIAGVGNWDAVITANYGGGANTRYDAEAIFDKSIAVTNATPTNRRSADVVDYEAASVGAECTIKVMPDGSYKLWVIEDFETELCGPISTSSPFGSDQLAKQVSLRVGAPS